MVVYSEKEINQKSRIQVVQSLIEQKETTSKP
jgi:hypothetical protein